MTSVPYTKQLGEFLSADDIHALRCFIPHSRDEANAHIQAVYNLKLDTAFPAVVHIEPTNRCNQACVMCQHPTMTREVRHIDEALAIKAIDECAAAGPFWFLHFFFFGEPFLNPKTIDYMHYARERGIRNLAVTTNLSCLGDDTLRRLVDEQITSVHVSFEGLDRERYAEIRQRDHYDTVVRNLRTLLAYRRERGSERPWVSLTYVRTGETDAEIEAFRGQWRGQVNNFHISPQFHYRGRSQLARQQGTVHSGGILARDADQRLPCRQLWLRLAVLSNGEIVPCSQNMDGELSLGNLRDIGLAEAWTGDALAGLRTQHLTNRYDPRCVCSDCIDWDWSGKVDKRPPART